MNDKRAIPRQMTNTEFLKGFKKHIKYFHDKKGMTYANMLHGLNGDFFNWLPCPFICSFCKTYNESPEILICHKPCLKHNRTAEFSMGEATADYSPRYKKFSDHFKTVSLEIIAEMTILIKKHEEGS